MSSRRSNEYQDTLKILEQLDKGDLKEGLFSTFALSKRGEVLWFDQTGTPWGVDVQGSAMVKTRPLTLPTQRVQVVTVEEAYQQIVRNEQNRYLTVLSTLRLETERRSSSGLLMILLILAGMAALVFVLKPFESNQIVNGNDVKIVNTGRYNPIAGATISRETFKAFLKEMNSPALPEADSMYQACVQEGCDPAVAAAFFEHESSGGNQGVAAITRSLGNIRCTDGYDCYSTPGNGAFRLYKSWTDSVHDWAKLLKIYRDNYGRKTLEEIIPMYAPQSDNNNEAAYIAAVKQRVDDLRNRELGLQR